MDACALLVLLRLEVLAFVNGYDGILIGEILL